MRGLAMLADVGRLLVASLDPDATLQSLARITVPTLADMCVVHMFVDDELQRVAVFTAPGMEDLAGATVRSVAFDGRSGPSSRPGDRHR